MKDKRFYLPSRCLLETGPSVEVKIKKGVKEKISWGCLSALIEAKIATKYAEILLEEEGLKLDECSLEDEGVIEGQYYER
tara:strand:- start:1 stop:240 length:240 start_codon:yes stop_codon:yes gene_type:complete